MANSEIIVNDKIAAVLRRMDSDWRLSDHITSESTGVFKSKSLRPDILILEPGVPPISLETEFEPARTVEADAGNRLGQVAIKSGTTIKTAFAIVIPARFKDTKAEDLEDALLQADDFRYCVLSGDSSTSYHRWPDDGYVEGSIEHLLVALQGAATPKSYIEAGADALESGASDIAAIMAAMCSTHAGVTAKVGGALKQEENLQTFRMAATVLINAFVFQENLAGRSGGLEDVKSLDELAVKEGKLSKSGVLSEWGEILNINYWPIFGIAKSILEVVPANVAAEILEKMHATASILLTLNLGKNSDLSGIIFQRLISDRRFLATFYTTPASAALLAGLVIDSSTAPNGVAWTDPAVTDLRIADFACGTGSLLCSVYAEVRRRLEISGVETRKLHAAFIERCLLGCDVLPSATHITASMLSSAFPEQQYKHTNILTLPYGRQPDGSVSLGGIEFLSTQGALSIIDTGASGVGAVGDLPADPWAVTGGTEVSDSTFDLIVMNPPFTRLTGGGGKSGDIPLPMFAAFGTEEDEQRLMSARTKKITAGTAAHGNAGEASIFVQIAHNKLRKGGQLGLVLPLTFLSGAAWQKCRDLIRKNYEDILVVTIVGTESGNIAFSADTGVGECLLLGRKTGSPSTRLVSVNLHSKPAVPFEGAEIARLIRQRTQSGNVATLEDGPIGGTPVFLGDARIGEMISGPLRNGEPWPLFRIADHAVAQVAYQLTAKETVWLPGMPKKAAFQVKLCRLSDIGEIGPYHLDINGTQRSGGAPRGPFEVVAVSPGREVTYPVLASHDAERERTPEVPFDAEGIARVSKDKEEVAILERRRERIWESRSRFHVNTDFRFNSQSLACCLTPVPSIGGRAWPSVKMNEPGHEIVAALWGNSTFGLLTYWWYANKAQDGRGSITTTQIPRLPVLDPRALPSKVINKAVAFFEEIKTRPMKPAHQASDDEVRKRIDAFVMTELLGADPSAMDFLDKLRKKLILEPSFNGGKA